MSMEFRDEVILGLECCIKSDETGLCPAECQARYKYGHECETGLKRDALELLKEQEPIEPKVDVDQWRCGNCGHELEHQELLGENVLFHEQYSYCPQCGKAVKWDE